jgi:hypothetical protein
MKQTLSGFIAYPYHIIPCSEAIGKMRHQLCIEHMKNTQYDRGEKNELYNIIGVRGELIFSYVLSSMNKPHILNRLLDEHPVCECDIICNEKKIDVKTTEQSQFSVGVNAYKKKIVDFFAFIQLLPDQNAFYQIINYSNVASWPTKMFYNSEKYYKLITNAA